MKFQQRLPRGSVHSWMIADLNVLVASHFFAELPSAGRICSRLCCSYGTWVGSWTTWQFQRSTSRVTSQFQMSDPFNRAFSGRPPHQVMSAGQRESLWSRRTLQRIDSNRQIPGQRMQPSWILSGMPLVVDSRSPVPCTTLEQQAEWTSHPVTPFQKKHSWF